MRTLVLLAAALLTACTVSSHASEPSKLGTPKKTRDLSTALAAGRGPIEVQTVVSADWAIDRSGLINLDHPTAKAAGLKDGDEPIKIYFHVLRHPTHGLYLIDSGVQTAMRDAPDDALLSGMAAKAMHADRLRVHEPLGAWLAARHETVKGVLLTHLHLDHLLGVPDLPGTTPLYTGPGEAGARGFMNMFVHGITNRALEGKPALREWPFVADPKDGFLGVLDVFGDGSLWALWTPGHTAGSTSYVARTPSGPVLFTGDACHTRWGWEHGVEPGTFTADRSQSVRSLAGLRKLAADHPKLQVRLGHQP